MGWNHKTRAVAMGVAIQPTPGVFVAPGVNDLIPVQTPQNAEEIIQAEDPTATGAIWAAPRIFLGKTGTAGATMAIRGPGQGTVPAANVWGIGRILQAAGFTEVRNGAAINANLVAGSTTSELRLAATESAIDDAMVGVPIRHANIGADNTVKGTALIVDYAGATKAAKLSEILSLAPAAATQYTIPGYLQYVLGTLLSPPPLLSISVWRDKKRYDYRDCRPTSLTFDMQVSNESNQSFPSVEAQFKGIPLAPVDDNAMPALPAAIMQVPIPPYKGGKFHLDQVMLGHQSHSFQMQTEVMGASNANATEGQDGYEIMSGTRTATFDLNQMAVADINLETRVTNQTIMPCAALWGMGAGNRFAFLMPELMLDPINNPGDRNGFVNLTGNAAFAGVDKSAVFTVFW